MSFNAAFWKWFGKSKVVDGDDDPRVVYHGTGHKFTTFKKTRIGDPHEGGFFFSDSDLIAREYGRYLMRCFLRLSNPYVIPYDGWSATSEPGPGEIKRAGHDGIVITDFDISGGNAYIVYEPSQIKAIGNDGTWDADDADIRSNPPITFKESVSANWGLGTIRRLPSNGHLQELTETPLKYVLYTPGNKIYAASVEKWLKAIDDGEPIPPPDIRFSDGVPVIEDGHHRIEAARQLKIKSMPMWVEILHAKTAR